MISLLYWFWVVFLVTITIPIFIIIALAIMIVDGFPVLFVQKRVGKNGKLFRMYKFRTMVTGAELLQTKYKKLNIAHGPVFKIYNDPRHTQIGKWLTHTGLDELPQLWNVLRGDMALFGPRPLPIPEERKLALWQKKREHIKPGIISPWVLEGYHATPFDAWMRSDIAYIKKKSLWYDTQLFFRTIRFLLSLVKIV